MYRLVVYKRDDKPSTHYFDDYEEMDYNATLLQFSSNPDLSKVVAEEARLFDWKKLFTIYLCV